MMSLLNDMIKFPEFLYKKCLIGTKEPANVFEIYRKIILQKQIKNAYKCVMKKYLCPRL